MFIINGKEFLEKRDIAKNDDEMEIWKYALQESGLKPFICNVEHKGRCYGYLKEDAKKIRAILDKWCSK